MSCFFCNSSYHVSHYCDKFISDESRTEVASLKKCCPYCFVSATHPPCVKCETDRKCFICFSTTHFSVYCPDRFVGPVFYPNIVRDLFTRFENLLEPGEMLLIPFSYPYMLDSMKLKPFKVKYAWDTSVSKIKHYQNLDFFSANKFLVDAILKFSTLKYPVFYIKHLEILLSTFSSVELLLLLSSKTNILKCVNIKFSTKLSFGQILEKAPKLEDIDISGSQIKVNNSWPDDFLLFNHADDFTDLSLSVTDLDFNVEKLATLMKDRAAEYIEINLHLTSTGNKKEIFESAKKKLSEFFVPSKNEWQQHLKILLPNGDYEGFTQKGV